MAARYRHATSRRLSIITVGAAMVTAASVAFAVGGTAVESGSAGAPSEYEDGRIAARMAGRVANCPAPLRAGRFAPTRIMEATRREVPRVYADMRAQGELNAWRENSVIDVSSLDVEDAHSAPVAWRRALHRYGAAARSACGGTVARRSWVALIHFPRGGNALVGEGVVFLARSRDGWGIWATTIASELPGITLVPEPTSDRSVSSRNCDLDSARRAGRTVLLYLQKENYDRRRRFPGDSRTYVPVARTITDVEARAPLRAVLLRLMKGATKRERRLGCFSIFSNDAHVLRAVKIVDRQAVVDFHGPPFRDQLAIVSASHAGAVFMTQLELTIFQFPNVDSIRYEFDGDCTAFGEFMQAGRCVVVRRSDRNRATA